MGEQWVGRRELLIDCRSNQNFAAMERANDRNRNTFCGSRRQPNLVQGPSQTLVQNPSPTLVQTPLQTSADEVASRATLSEYLNGQATGNADFYRRAFREEAKLFGVRNGKVEKWTPAEYLGLQSGRAAADEEQRKRRIANIIVTGDVAIATIVLDYPSALTTDHMSLAAIMADG